MEELVPKATGFQARIDKKLAISQQRRDKDISPGKTTALSTRLLGHYQKL